MTGTVFDIKEMAVHDGHGLRTTVFLKGCPLRCKWCHNPEGLSTKPQLMYKTAKCRHCDLCKRPCTHADCKPYGRCLHICPENCLVIAGTRYEAKELAEKLIKGARILGENFGGVTFSGGEPLLQGDFVIETAKYLEGINLGIETSGYAENETFKKVLDVLDFVIMDIKIADRNDHKTYTGVYNDKILENLETLKKSAKPYIIRTPLIPDITDTEQNLTAIKDIIGDCKWEKLPYNAMAGAKYKMLGMDYSLGE